jgi:hypothetical protein
MLRRIAWSSVPSSSFSAARLGEIVAPARWNNKANDVSGMLLYTGTHFLEILEGEESVLNEMWSRLVLDDRHASLVRIGDEACNERRFADWKMAYADDLDVGSQVETLRHPTTQNALTWSDAAGSIMACADSM